MYRIVNLCVAIVGRSELEKIAVAAVFHDLGIWTNGTFDYIAPSIALAHDYLVARAREDWTAEIEGMIADHHKITPSTADPDSLIEAFRRADWIDVTRGLRGFGIPRPFVARLFATWPSAGFHWRLVHVDSRSVPKPSADAVANGQTVMATRTSIEAGLLTIAARDERSMHSESTSTHVLSQQTSIDTREEEEMTIATTEPTITEHEAAQVERANASSATPVVFVHGLWLLPSSWDRWVTLFEEAGYVALTPGWPDDPETVAEAREHPEVFAGKGIREIADYEEAIIRRLDRKPVIIGHSFGGLLTMILAGRGLAAASVAISPAPFRGVLPLPISALRTASVALRNPANWNRAVPLSYEQFRYSFANAVGEDEAKELYLGYSVPGAGEPLFQAASANFNPWSEAKVDSTNPERGPMLIVSADSDHTVPWAIANASYKKQKRNKGVTEIVKMPGRGHALTIDAGWREVAEKALEFVKRFTAGKRKVA